jgi:hypothetical protein
MRGSVSAMKQPLDDDIMDRVFRRAITSDHAFAIQAARIAGLPEPEPEPAPERPVYHRGVFGMPQPAPMSLPRPCTDSPVTVAYKAAALWIDAEGPPDARALLAVHREAVEPRRAVAEGGDGSLGGCVVTRRRADIVAAARAAGWKTTPVETPATGYVDPAARAIRESAPDSTHAYIVGKGPSLDILTASNFPDAAAPVLCCNEAIRRIETLGLPNPLFGVQQDARVGFDGRPMRGGTWLLSSQSWTACHGAACPNAIRYDPVKIGGHAKSLTADQCMRLLGSVGFTAGTMLAFDACTSGEIDYAASIGKSPGQYKQDAGRFKGYCVEISKCGLKNGVSLTWKPPHEWMVLCVLKGGGKYGREHVEWLREQVARRIKTPHYFRCLTDSPDLGPTAIGLAHNWPGWWAKPQMFRPGTARACALYLDLDVVLCRDFELPDPATIEPDTLYARADWGRPGEINSSVMMWRGDGCRAVYDRMATAPQQTMQAYSAHGDQAFTSAIMADRIKPLPLAVNSYKLSHAEPADTDIMVFHGQPKPWDLDRDWIPPMVPAADIANAPGSSRATWLANLCKSIGAAVAVEVGVKEGRTSEVMLRENQDLRLYGVDLFAPQPQITDGEHYMAWDWPAIEAEYHTRMAPYGERSVTLKADQCAAAAMVTEPVDIVFLDADHRTEATRKAIRAWLPLIRPGGILAGHDYNWPSVKAAVAAELIDIKEGPDHCWWYTVIPTTVPRYYSAATQREGNPDVLVSPGLSPIQKATHGGILALQDVLALGWDAETMARSTLLDFGCGTGRVSRVLCGLFRETLGYDPNRRAIERARTECPPSPVARLDFPGLRYAETLEGEGQYDVAISHNVFEHLTEADCLAAWALLCAHVAPGGTILANLHCEDNAALARHLSLSGTGIVWYRGPPVAFTPPAIVQEAAAP